MHKLNTYGTWEDNNLFWSNEIINCSKYKKLKKDYKKLGINNNNEFSNNSNKSNRKYSDKTESNNGGSNKIIFNCRKKKINSNKLS
jgi:hypothetical protein